MKYICLNFKLYLSKFQNVFVSNCKIYMSHIEKLICLKFWNVFVSNCKMYLSQIAKFICLKLQNVFISNCQGQGQISIGQNMGRLLSFLPGNVQKEEKYQKKLYNSRGVSKKSKLKMGRVPYLIPFLWSWEIPIMIDAQGVYIFVIFR